MFTLKYNFERTNHYQVSGYIIPLAEKEIFHHIGGTRQNGEKNSVYQKFSLPNFTLLTVRQMANLTSVQTSPGLLNTD